MILTQKTCSRCKITKSAPEFGARPERPGGLRSKCKNCEREIRRDYYKKDPLKGRAYQQAYYAENREQVLEKAVDFRFAHKEEIAEYDRVRRKKNGETYRERARELYAENRSSIAERKKTWRDLNADRLRAEQREKRLNNIEDFLAKERRGNQLRLSTPRGKLENAIRQGFVRGLKRGVKAGRKTFDLLGYSVDDVISHIEPLLADGMTWENYGKGGWHIDHIVPLSVHNYESPDDIDFKRAWALSNLQPLWEFDNLSKGAKLTEPFQPSLAFAA